MKKAKVVVPPAGETFHEVLQKHLTDTPAGAALTQYLVVPVTKKGETPVKWAGYMRIAEKPGEASRFHVLTLSFFSAHEAAEALTNWLKGKKL